MVEDTIVPNESNDPPNGEDSLKLNELMELCTTLQVKVLNLEKTKAYQQLKIESLDRRVKKLEKDKKKRTHKLKRLYKVGLSARVISSDDEEPDLEVQKDEFKQGRSIADIDKDAEVILVDDVQGRRDEGNEEIFDAEKDLAGEEVVVEEVIAEEVVVEKVAKKIVEEKVAEIALNDDEITLARTLQKLKNTPKAKGVASKQHILLDEEEERRLQAIFDEEARMAKEEAEKEAKLVEDWDNVKAKMDTDYELASKLQAEEQEELTIEEKSKLFIELMEKRKRHFAAKRAEEKRNKPPTKAQKRKTMSTYLKNMDGWKLDQLKGKSYNEVEKLFHQAMARINNFVGMDSAEEAKKLEGTSKRASDETEGKSRKKQKMDDEEIANFDREDLETLWKLVKARHGDTRPDEGYERLMWSAPTQMFKCSSLHVGRKEVPIDKAYSHRYVKQEATVNAASSELMLLEKVTTAAAAWIEND
ncbi:hypothetical protein Tco_1283550 [Tanacetum coccineum]